MRIAIFLLCAFTATASIATVGSTHGVKLSSKKVVKRVADLTSISSDVVITAAKKVVAPPPPPKQDTLKLVGLFALW